MMDKVNKILFIFLMTLSATAQKEEIPYLDFSLQASGSKVVVTWRVKAGNTCQDVQVWRGANSLDLKEIYTYPGICGDNDSSKTYTYTDTPPVQGIYYYYRIVVIIDRTISKKVLVTSDYSLELYPNPAIDKIHLVFNPENAIEVIEIFDSTGRKVKTLENPESPSELEVSGWKAGEYFYRTVINDKPQVGSFIVK